MRNKLSKIFASGTALLSLSTSAFAQATENPINWIPQISGNLAERSLQDIIIDVINWLIGAAVLVCVVMLVISGYSYMTAGGDEQKVTKATKTLTNAIIGLVISLLALVLVNFIRNTFLGQTNV
jgi:hypothetical protein